MEVELELGRVKSGKEKVSQIWGGVPDKHRHRCHVHICKRWPLGQAVPRIFAWIHRLRGGTSVGRDKISVPTRRRRGWWRKSEASLL